MDWIPGQRASRNGNDVDPWIEDPRDSASAKMLTQLAGGGASVEDWSPDGKAIAALDTRSINDSTIYLIDAATGKKHAVTPDSMPAAEQISWANPGFLQANLLDGSN